MKQITAIYNKDWNGVVFPKLAVEAPELIEAGMITNILYIADTNVERSAEAAIANVLKATSSLEVESIRGTKYTHQMGERAYSVTSREAQQAATMVAA